jgi:GTP-binding protein
VGKSSVFNWLAGRRIAIVDPTAGVTRDRISTVISVGDRFVELIDTGGMGIEDSQNLTPQVERQIEAALDQADVVLFVVDGRAGLMPLDEEVAARLRYVTKPMLCVANKCDTEQIDPQAAEFYKLGRGKLVCVSAQQNRGRDEVLELIAERLPEPGADDKPPEEVALKLAIVGRRNTGKSTFINCLAESERMIVSEVPGTTRDSVDVRFSRDGLTFIAIDTAGVRKRTSITGDIEFYSIARAERSVRRADVVLLFFDARLRISKVDKQLADYVLEQHKPAIFVINKWDLMLPMPTGRMAQYFRATFPSLDFVPMAFITAKQNKNVHAVLNLAQNLHKQASERVSTADLNRVLRDAVQASPPPMRMNRRPKVYYGTQVGANPPTIVLFTNGPSLFDNTYQRYLLTAIRDQLAFREVPIKLYLRHKRREDRPPVEEAPPTVQATDVTPPPPTRPSPPKKTKANTSVEDLSFQTDVTDEEIERERKPGQPDLWRDL